MKEIQIIPELMNKTVVSVLLGAGLLLLSGKKE